MATLGQSIGRALLPLFVAAWCCLVVCAWWALWRFEFAPGAPAAAPPVWPADSAIIRSAERERLLIFAHPHCPCTRATIGELAELLTRLPEPIDVSLLFFRPAKSDSQWARSALWELAAGIPGVELREDPDIAEARRFGVSTSGQALLYDRAGNLLLSTGLTASRGHAGPSPGRTSLERLLTRQENDGNATDVVFGCPLSRQVNHTSAGTDAP